jgi:two-component system sensor histidine kinase MprB
MSLRARLAVALAVLAALSVVAVAAISYAATEQRLRAEVDAGLRTEAGRLEDPHAPTARLCEDLVRGGPARQLGGPLAGLRGAVIQCLDAGGAVTVALGPEELPLERPGVDVSEPLGLRRPWTQTFGDQAYRVIAIPRPGGGQLRIGRSLAETERVLASVRNSSALVGLAIIVLAAGAGLLIARQATRPVTRLTDAAERIAATGRLDIAVPGGDGGRDEIGRLARAFSAMLAALTRSRDQQQRLVQDAGHELRTPLTSLRANIDTLRRHPDLAAAPRGRLLGDLDSELRELSALVDELVALAVDRYDDEPEQTVALDQLARRAADRARRRGGRRIEVDTAPAPVVARPQQLLRAVGNLLDNAAKFSPDGTPIEVTVRPGTVQVRDHGPGVAAGDLARVFDRFYRALDARSLPGSGLGLAIVRQIVDDAGGTVEAANHPGGGAVFTIRLPGTDA